jgi:hypothetical protein
MMPRRAGRGRVAGMWWGIGGGLAILWLVLLIVLGISCLRKGHWVMFIIGFIFPLFWIIGAVIPPVASKRAY